MKKTNKMKTCSKPLRSNPFISQRDPQTGRWVVLKDKTKEAKSDKQLVSAAA